MVAFGLVPIISFTVFLFYSFFVPVFVYVPVPISLPTLVCQFFTFLPSFLVYFPTFTSLFPRNLIGFSLLLWRLRIRVSTARARFNIRKCRKRRKWRERRSHWGLKLRTCDTAGINVLCNVSFFREDPVFLVNIVKHSPPDASVDRRRIKSCFHQAFQLHCLFGVSYFHQICIIWHQCNRAKTSFTLLTDPMNHIAFVYIKIVFFMPLNLLWS